MRAAGSAGFSARAAFAVSTARSKSSFDEPASGYEWGLVVHDPAAPVGYQPKEVLGFLKTATTTVPAYPPFRAKKVATAAAVSVCAAVR